MAFAMRMKLNPEIIKKKTFRNLYINGARNGFEFDVQLAYYRGHYLSDIDLLEVYLDGEKMPQEAVTFELKGKELPVYKLTHAVTEFWNQVEPAKIHREDQIERAFERVVEKLDTKSQKILRDYINAISADLSEENELFYRAGVRDGVNLDRLVKEMKESK